MANQSIVSKRAMALKPSLTLEISARAKALKAEGRDICSLSAGEPDFNTPQFIVEEAIRALHEGHTRYGPAAGDPELRQAIAEKLTNINKIRTKPDEVLITNGGKQAIYNLLQVIINQDDEVIIPGPYWLSYPEIVGLAGGVPIIIKSDPSEGFKLDLELLEESINNKTKLIIINSPSNPTGRLVSEGELLSIAGILRKYPNVFLLSDEIYEYILAEDKTHYSFAAIAPDLKDRIFTVNGFAKAWAMTGWRIGYLSGNKEIIKACTALQSQSTSNVCSFAQKGAIAAVNGPKEIIKEMSCKYNTRRDLLTTGIRKIDGLTLIPPEGAFYAFPKLPEVCSDSISFCKVALEEFGLAIVPGKVFGEDRCIRISCAASDEVINDGLLRLAKLVSSY